MARNEPRTPESVSQDSQYEIFHTLPSETNQFVGRTKLVEQITDDILDNENRLSVIVGSKGVGKSALATMVGHYFTEYDTFADGILYIPLYTLYKHYNCHTFDDCLLHILNRCKARDYWRMHEKLTKANLYESIEQYMETALFVIDDFDRFAESANLTPLEMGRILFNIFNTIHVDSRVIITAREQLPIFNNFYCFLTKFYHLEPLDMQSAIDLVSKLTDYPIGHIRNHWSQLRDITAFKPLHIKKIGRLHRQLLFENLDFEHLLALHTQFDGEYLASHTSSPMSALFLRASTRKLKDTTSPSPVLSPKARSTSPRRYAATHLKHTITSGSGSVPPPITVGGAPVSTAFVTAHNSSLSRGGSYNSRSQNTVPTSFYKASSFKQVQKQQASRESSQNELASHATVSARTSLSSAFTSTTNPPDRLGSGTIPEGGYREEKEFEANTAGRVDSHRSPSISSVVSVTVTPAIPESTLTTINPKSLSLLPSNSAHSPGNSPRKHRPPGLSLTPTPDTPIVTTEDGTIPSVADRYLCETVVLLIVIALPPHRWSRTGLIAGVARALRCDPVRLKHRRVIQMGNKHSLIRLLCRCEKTEVNRFKSTFELTFVSKQLHASIQDSLGYPKLSIPIASALLYSASALLSLYDKKLLYSLRKLPGFEKGEIGSSAVGGRRRSSILGDKALARLASNISSRRWSLSVTMQEQMVGGSGPSTPSPAHSREGSLIGRRRQSIDLLSRSASPDASRWGRQSTVRTSVFEAAGHTEAGAAANLHTNPAEEDHTKPKVSILSAPYIELPLPKVLPVGMSSVQYQEFMARERGKTAQSPPILVSTENQSPILTPPNNTILHFLEFDWKPGTES